MTVLSDTLGPRRLLVESDRSAFLAILGLLAVSLVALYSVTHPQGGGEGSSILEVGRGVFWRQVVWVGIGLLALWVGFSVPFRTLETTAWLQYGLVLGLLALVLSMPNRSGAGRWIFLGPVQFQPSEFAKIAVLFVVARYLAKRPRAMQSWRHMVAPFLITIPPVALILQQPDLGTSLVFFAILVPMLFWAGLEPLRLLLLASPGLCFLLHLYARTRGEDATWVWLATLLVVFVAGLWRRRALLESLVLLAFNLSVRFIESSVWERLRDYQKNRILTFFAPDLDRLGQGYHVTQSKIAVGSGGLLGKGFMAGTQKELAFLPARHTDFIFSVVGEEFGFVGSLVVLGLFAVLIVRGLSFASRCRNSFARYAAIGIVAYLSFQMVQNVGMTVGLFPVAGIPLPLVSYGGTSLVTTLFLLGVLLNLGRRWREY